MDSLDNADSKDTNRPKRTYPESSNNKPRSILLVVISVFCIFSLVTVFVSQRISSTISQVPTAGTGLTVSHSVDADKSPSHNQVRPQQRNIPADHTMSNIRKLDTTISYEDFRQEAQNILFREEENIVKVSNHASSIEPAISAEDFKVEAHKTLYRDSKY